MLVSVVVGRYRLLQVVVNRCRLSLVSVITELSFAFLLIMLISGNSCIFCKLMILKGFCYIYNFLMCTKSSLLEVLSKKDVLKIPQNSQEKTCAGAYVQWLNYGWLHVAVFNELFLFNEWITFIQRINYFNSIQWINYYYLTNKILIANNFDPTNIFVDRINYFHLTI